MSDQHTSYGLPARAETYEMEYDYWPWGDLIRFVAGWVERNVPANAKVLDYMCGTGFLLNELADRRPDLDCFGCSITPEYINYAKKVYTNIEVELCDALLYKPIKTPDIVICTAGIHHLPWESQNDFVKKVASEIESGRIFIVGEELIRNYKNEKMRRLAIIEMITDATGYMIEKDVPPDIIAGAADLLKADLLAEEYKIDLETILAVLNTYFQIDEQHCLWPKPENEYGDYIFICRKL